MDEIENERRGRNIVRTKNGSHLNWQQNGQTECTIELNISSRRDVLRFHCPTIALAHLKQEKFRETYPLWLSLVQLNISTFQQSLRFTICALAKRTMRECDLLDGKQYRIRVSPIWLVPVNGDDH